MRRAIRLKPSHELAHDGAPNMASFFAFRRWLAHKLLPLDVTPPPSLPPKLVAPLPIPEVIDTRDARVRELEGCVASLNAALNAAKQDAKEKEDANEKEKEKETDKPTPTTSADGHTKDRGKRMAELERRVEDAESAAARHRGRADDAEGHAADLEQQLHKLRAPGGEPAGDGLSEVWWSPGDACVDAILRELERAEETVDVCVFTITDDRLAQALVSAHRRRVRVRILTDNDKSYDEGSDIARLSDAGIEVRVDRTEYHMHHKFAVFDGRRALTGSYNWTRGAARNNEEHIVVTRDAHLTAELARGFGKLWRKFEP